VHLGFHFITPIVPYQERAVKSQRVNSPGGDVATSATVAVLQVAFVFSHSHYIMGDNFIIQRITRGRNVNRRNCT